MLCCFASKGQYVSLAHVLLCPQISRGMEPLQDLDSHTTEAVGCVVNL